MYASSTTQTRTASTSSTCTKSRVETVLDMFCGDLCAFIARGFLSRDNAVEWLRDLGDVLVLEVVDRFQVKITFPRGGQIALDYEVSDDGKLRGSDPSGGISTTSIPDGSDVSVVVSWRKNAPRLAAARKLLQDRGWGPGSILAATGAVDRAFAEGGYGVYRRTVGAW